MKITFCKENLNSSDYKFSICFSIGNFPLKGSKNISQKNCGYMQQLLVQNLFVKHEFNRKQFSQHPLMNFWCFYLLQTIFPPLSKRICLSLNKSSTGT